MIKSTQDFESDISSLDKITYDIDKDVLEAILDQNSSDDDRFDEAFGSFNDEFLDTLKEKNNKDSRYTNIKHLESIIFDAKEQPFILEKEKNDVVKNFDTLITEPISTNSSFALSKEQQMDKINQYSKNLIPKFLELKRSLKKNEKKKHSVPFPISSGYRDFSNVTDEEVHLKYNNMVGRSQELFPAKLHKIIDLIERDGLSFIVSWCPHGRAFKIHNNTLFIKNVTSRYFHQTKITSFTRQLGGSCLKC